MHSRQKYIWNGKDHLLLKDVWEYLNRYTYLPRIKGRSVLIKTVQSAVGGMLPGPFAYAERWDAATSKYLGLAIEKCQNAMVVIDSDSLLVAPEVAEQNRPEPFSDDASTPNSGPQPTSDPAEAPPLTPDPDPTRFIGTVMISSDRPAHEMRKVVEAIVEQLTVLPNAFVSLKLEIDAEVKSGLDRSKVRTLIENANTLGFIDKKIE